ncbi:hypothetical protein SCHPADRAFT_203563 [Schizopora paradoxa]|uniref:Uncharacterized protein n=1 Tax=Schizopora paradoxa TaxID=27342 RepID=A0A0H2SHZ9_9AGAM|nr:hypothetical protein SCHPADRAFT_203563 [Schizopora paradoxa]
MHAITADKYPAFLYEKNGAEYDHRKMTKGLFRGYFLLRVYKLIFLGATSAIKATPGKGTGKRKCVAEKHHLTRATAIQARLTLSTMDQWGEHDGDFSVLDFYNNIHDFLVKNEKTKWCKEFYAWFNHNVFGVSSNTTDSTTPPDTTDDFNEIQRQLDEEERLESGAQDA